MVSLCRQLLSSLLKSACPKDLETANRLIKATIEEVRSAAAFAECVFWLFVDTLIFFGLHVRARAFFFFKEKEKTEKVSKREFTLKEVESSTKDLRDVLERQAISGTMLELSDDVMVGGEK